jgi:hypothetical protein
MRSIASLLLIAALFAFSGCSGSGSSSSDGAAGVDGSDASENDAGLDGGPFDAFMRDASPPLDANIDRGVRIAGFVTNPPQIVAVTADESQLYFDQDGHLWSASLTNPDQKIDRGIQADEWFASPKGPNLWMLRGLPASSTVPGQGALDVLAQSSTKAPVQVTTGAIERLVFRPEDTSLAIAARNLQLAGTASTATLTADLVMYKPDGTATPVLSGVHLGAWAARRASFSGACAMRGLFTSSTTAFLELCTGPAGPSDVRKLLFYDASSGQPPRVVATDVQPYLQLSADRSFLLFADNARHIFAVDTRTASEMHALPASEEVTSLQILDGKRFAYVTATRALKLASWPSMNPYVAVASSVLALDAASPSGRYLMFHLSRSPTTHLSDLYLILTSTPAGGAPLPLNAMQTSYPAGDPFADDSAFVYWYANVDTNSAGVADLMSRPVAGRNGTTLATRATAARNYSDPNAVFVFANAMTRGTGTGVAIDSVDMGVTKRDGSGMLDVLVSGVDPSDFLLLPNSRSAVIYRLLSGGYAGLWIRSLPTAP